ncbi:MAG: LPS-assembly protein LptD, partial [Nitrosospira sp.]
MNQRPNDIAAEKNVPVERSSKAPESMQVKPKQDDTLLPTVTGGLPLEAATTGAEGKEKVPVLAGTDNIPGHLEQQDETNLRNGTQSAQVTPAGTPAKSGIPIARAEANRNRTLFTDTDRIPDHLAQEGDTRLRLAGAVAPYEVPSVALKDGTKKAAPVTMAEKKKNRPIFVAGDRLEGHVEKELEAIGKAELFNG